MAYDKAAGRIRAAAAQTDGSEEARCLTEANQAWDSSPAFSPDGSSLAYLAMVRPGYEADRRRRVSLQSVRM